MPPLAPVLSLRPSTHYEPLSEADAQTRQSLDGAHPEALGTLRRGGRRGRAGGLVATGPLRRAQYSRHGVP